MKKAYINPECNILHMTGRYGFLEEMSYSKSTISDEGDIGFSKEQDFDDDSDDERSSIWDD